ncbi:hypothetical protein [Desulfovulcanus sp.]
MSAIKFNHPFLNSLLERTNTILNKTGIWASSIWNKKQEEVSARQSYKRLAQPLVRSLEQKLKAFEETLSKFDWPVDNLPWHKSTLTRLDPLLENKIKAVTPGQIILPYKYFSRGFSPHTTCNIPTGDYKFTLSLNGKSQTLTVSITEGQTNAEVLEAVKDAINESSLPVQAEIVHHYTPYQQLDSPSLGHILAISVNPPYAEQKLEIKDTKGLLLNKLGLYSVDGPISGARTTAYLLQGRRVASPSLFTSSAFAANDEIDWEIKKYSFNIKLNDETTEISLFVVDKATWDEARTLAQDQQALVKDTADWESKVNQLTFGSSEIDDNTTWASLISQISGQGLVVFTDSTYQDLLSGLVRYVNSSLSSIQADVNEREVPNFSLDQLLFSPKLFLEFNLKEPKLGDRMYLEDGQGSPLELLGMKSTARPGSDAVLNINGQTRRAPANWFAEDKGRLTIELEDVFGQSLPLSIVQAMEEIHARLNEVIQAYNDLLEFLQKDKELFDEELISDWKKPVNDLETDLTWLGIQKTKEKGLLWISGDRFWQALGENKVRAKRILLDEGKGLIPKWEDMVSYMNKKGLESFLLPATAYVDHYPPWRKSLDNELKENLLDLFE